MARDYSALHAAVAALEARANEKDAADADLDKATAAAKLAADAQTAAQAADAAAEAKLVEASAAVSAAIKDLLAAPGVVPV